jgi:metal-responsive CopG/Arc/MetJ family transcriptional regulator
MKTNDPSLSMGISLPTSLVQLIDDKRGLVTRSAYIKMLLRKALGAS